MADYIIRNNFTIVFMIPVREKLLIEISLVQKVTYEYVRNGLLYQDVMKNRKKRAGKLLRERGQVQITDEMLNAEEKYC